MVATQRDAAALAKQAIPPARFSRRAGLMTLMRRLGGATGGLAECASAASEPQSGQHCDQTPHPLALPMDAEVGTEAMLLGWDHS